jgi:hypothetical protein
MPMSMPMLMAVYALNQVFWAFCGETYQYLLFLKYKLIEATVKYTFSYSSEVCYRASLQLTAFSQL